MRVGLAGRVAESLESLESPVFDERCEEPLYARTGDNKCFFCPPSANFSMMMCGCEGTVSTIAIRGAVQCDVSGVGVRGVEGRPC